MIYCNLSGLMATKKVNISTVSRDTGISRTTLTGLYYNNFKGIQLDTLNVLCRYFNVTTEKMLIFSRYDIDVKFNFFNSDHIDFEELPEQVISVIDFEISVGEIKRTVSTCCTLYLHWSNNSVSIEADLEYYEPTTSEEQDENCFLKKAISSLSVELRAYIESLVVDEILKEYGSNFGDRETDISLCMNI